MNQEKYLNDLQEIKEMMNRSSRFISLSGLSGVAAGVSALVGAYLAYRIIYSQQADLDYRVIHLGQDNIMYLVLIAVGTLIVALGSGIYFTSRVTKKRNEKIWTPQVKQLLITLSIPLVTGGVVCLILLIKGFAGIIAPLTLVFYGLALVNGSKYTLKEVHSLGIAQIILGIISLWFVGYGLFFWAFGFGILHIVYGVVMHIKYKNK